MKTKEDKATYMRQYYAKKKQDPDYRTKYNKMRNNWYHKNNHKGREIAKTYRRKVKEELVLAFGGKCQCCGETIIEFLTFDHSNNDGHKHRKEMRGDTLMHLYKWYKSGETDFTIRVLCYNCHFSFTYLHYCPHT